MQADKTIKALLDEEGISASKASILIGRSRTYIPTYVGKGMVPSIGLMAELGDSVGYDLLLRRRTDGHEIVIDPPQRE